ncbi:hypothetical protein [Streptomyces sp. NPDC002855]|uniref:hypothetical protein n=1 Tax=Streptomyces sp. NPDC002855 TaxID=3154437 RepID=UPI003317BF72
MSWQKLVPNPERFDPGTPWASHDWDENVPLWEDTLWWCRACGISAIDDGAHEKCSGVRPANGRFGPPSTAVLVTAVRERDEAVRSAA